MRLPRTPSGLTMDRVRSSAIRLDLIEKSTAAGMFAPARDAGAQASREVYLGSRTRGNLACDGSAGLVRVFAPQAQAVSVAAGAVRAPRSRRLQTEKLSPQPHSPLTFGVLERKASLTPCLTKSTIVPSSRPRLAASTNTCTPRSSNTASPRCGPPA